jgi:hypothetical protein
MSSTTVVGRSGTETWRVLRTPLLICGAIVLAVLVLVIATTARTSGPFSPDSAEPTGAKALATLLENHGVGVTGTEDVADATDSSEGRALLIAPGGALSGDEWQRIADAGWSHLVLVRPTTRALQILAPGVEDNDSLPEESRAPGCEITPAVRAGTATVSGAAYSAPDSADGCYGDGIRHTVVRLEVDGRTVDVVGTPRSFSNAGLAQDGNAALALNLIGTQAELTWFMPQFEGSESSGDDAGEQPVIPPQVRYVGWALAFAVLVLAFWRGRRLGPVVPEPLPVIVRAAETTEGRARLYRRSRARDRAAAALRESALGKLHQAHGIPQRTEPGAVVATVAARTGRDPAMLYELLYGPAPADDSALLSLSHELDVLTQEVQHP